MTPPASRCRPVGSSLGGTQLRLTRLRVRPVTSGWPAASAAGSAREVAAASGGRRPSVAHSGPACNARRRCHGAPTPAASLTPVTAAPPPPPGPVPPITPGCPIGALPARRRSVPHRLEERALLARQESTPELQTDSAPRRAALQDVTQPGAAHAHAWPAVGKAAQPEVAAVTVSQRS